MYTNDYKGELFKLKPDWYEVYDVNSTGSKYDSLVEFGGTDSFWYSVMLYLEKSDIINLNKSDLEKLKSKYKI